MSSMCPVWLSVSQSGLDGSPGVPQVTRKAPGVTVRTRCVCSTTERSDTDVDHFLSLQKRDAAFHARMHCGQDEIPGLRQLPRALIQAIFSLAAANSNFTRHALIHVCKSWRTVAFNIPALWSNIKLGAGAMSYDSLPLYIPEWFGQPVTPDTFQIHLAAPGPGELFDLIIKAPPEHWESLHITLGGPDPSPSFIEDIFSERRFPNLRELVIDEEPLWTTEMDGYSIGRDPYTSLYQSLCFTTTHLFKTVNINADIRGEASAYGLFGHAIPNVGGSIPFIRTALLQAAGSSEWRMASSLTSNISLRKYHYSHIVSLDLQSWDADTVEKLSLPNLLYLRVEHCHLEKDQTFRKVDDCRPALLMPTVVQLRLTSHSLTMLSQICTGNLELLVIEDKEPMNKFDGCLPAPTESRYDQPTPYLPTITTRAGSPWDSGQNSSGYASTSTNPLHLPLRTDRYSYRTQGDIPSDHAYEQHEPPKVKPHLGTFQFDKWSVLNIESATLNVPLEIQDLLEFLRNARGVRYLTIAIPSILPFDDLKEWKREFVERMTDRQFIVAPGQRYPSRPLFCCPQLEQLTLLIDGVWVEGEWVTELRNLMSERGCLNVVTGETEKYGRGDGHLRSIICRWSKDPRTFEVRHPPAVQTEHQTQSDVQKGPCYESDHSPQREYDLPMEQDEAYDGVDLSVASGSSLPHSPQPLPLSPDGSETASEHSQDARSLPEVVNWSSSDYEILSESDFSVVERTTSPKAADLTDDSEDYDMVGAHGSNVGTDSDEDWQER